jgi:hypothetical protein
VSSCMRRRSRSVRPFPLAVRSRMTVARTDGAQERVISRDCGWPMVRLFALWMSPSGGSTSMGRSDSSSSPRHPVPGSDHDSGVRPSAWTRSGSQPEITQPTRPVESASVTFCGGPFHDRATSIASSRLRASFMSRTLRFTASVSCALQRRASGEPSQSSSTIGPQRVLRTVSSRLSPPRTSIVSVRFSNSSQPSGVR